jgi:DNA ligase-associated metallophosphoesterase
VRIHIGEGAEPIDLFAGRAAYWPRRRTLVLADLHLGKSETFRAAGAPIPDGVHGADLARLQALVVETGASRLLVLGDLLHAGVGLTDRLVSEVAAWRARMPDLRIEVVPGNHDRAVGSVEAGWGLAILGEEQEEDGFRFRHDLPERPAGFTWCGHMHPLVWVGGRRTGVRMPCFWVGQDFLVLPAFSTFARGLLVDPAQGDRVFAVADGDVFEV